MTPEEFEKIVAKIERKQSELEAELNRLRKQGGKAHERIDELEREIKELRADISEMKTKINDIPAIKREVEQFTPNLWKAVFLLIVIVGGLAGVNLL